MPDADRLTMPLGQALYSQRAVRRVKPDTIPDADLRLLIEAAGQAPSSSNVQPWHFIVVTDRDLRQELQAIYHESWFNWFRSTGQDKLTDPPKHVRGAMRLTEELAEAPVLILACALAPTIPNELLAAAQNLLLAARGLGLAGMFVRFNASVEAKLRRAFNIPAGAELGYCIRLGYPLQEFGPLRRKAVREICSLNRFGDTPPWA